MDYCSQFFEVDYLPDPTSRQVIHKLKHHFARYGICDTLVTDNGSQFASDAFRTFTKSWAFNHETSSPGNSKANGAAEAAVKVAKRIMKKSKDSNEDAYLGFLNHRNTPTEGLKSSPAQRLMGRRTKTMTPTTSSKLCQSTFFDEEERSRMENKKAEVAGRFAHMKPL